MDVASVAVATETASAATEVAVEASVAAEAMEIVHKCIKQYVAIAAKNVKCHSDQPATNQFSVAIASRTKEVIQVKGDLAEGIMADPAVTSVVIKASRKNECTK